jgi:hypothetical protein
MESDLTLLIIIFFAFALTVFLIIRKLIINSKMTPEEKVKVKKVKAEKKAAIEADRIKSHETYLRSIEQQSVINNYGNIYPEIICPHCQKKGYVHVKQVTNKKGVSGGKATAALLTGGISLLATGLSRKEQGSQAHCDNCSMTWSF